MTYLVYFITMEPLADRSVENAALCKRFHVARLDVFGSAITEAFDPATSDIDFTVEFAERGRDRAFDNYFGLREALIDLFGRPVDLVERTAIRNPVFRTQVEDTAKTVYAEAN